LRLPARRPSTLTISPDGRIAVAIAAVASVITPSHAAIPGPDTTPVPGISAPAVQDVKSASTLNLAGARALYQDESAAHFVVRQPEAVLPQTTSTCVATIPAVEDVKALAWSPMSFGPSLLVVIGSGTAHLMRPPVHRRLVHADASIAPIGWDELMPPADGGFPRGVICAQFTQLAGDRNSNGEVALLALGTNRGLLLYAWSAASAFPVKVLTAHSQWTTAIEWLQGQSIPAQASKQEGKILAVGLDGKVALIRIDINFGDQKSLVPTAAASLLWTSGDDVLPAMVCSLAWWYNDTDTASDTAHAAQVFLGVGAGDSVSLFEWSKGVCGDIESPKYASSLQEGNCDGQIITEVAFLSSGQLLSASMDGSVLLWSWIPSFAKIGSHLVPDGCIRPSCAGRSVLGLSVSGLGMYVAVLTTVPSVMDDDPAEDNTNEKFAATSRLTRVFLQTPVLASGCDISSGLQDLLGSAVSRLLLAGSQYGSAFVTWDLELWLDYQCAEIRDRALEYLSSRLAELKSKIEKWTVSVEMSMRRVRALRSLAVVVYRYGRGDEAKGARQVYKATTDILVIDHCIESLACLHKSRLSSAINTDAGESLTSLEIRSARAMARLVLSSSRLAGRTDGDKCLELAHDILRLLAERTEVEDYLALCPLCNLESKTAPISFRESGDIASARNKISMEGSCTEGDAFPRCVLTMLPCTSAKPASCHGCGVKAYHGLVPEHSSDGYRAFSWLCRWQQCPFCHCALQHFSVDPIVRY
jgi:hypothetical protein